MKFIEREFLPQVVRVQKHVVQVRGLGSKVWLLPPFSRNIHLWMNMEKVAHNDFESIASAARTQYHEHGAAL